MEWDKQGFLMPARLFMWLYRQLGFSCLDCPLESVLWYEGITLMQADRRREIDEHIYVSMCVCVVCVKGKISAPLTDFPEDSSSVINLSLNVTSKNCSCACPFLPSLHRCTRALTKSEIIKVIHPGVKNRNRPTLTHLLLSKVSFHITSVGS